MENKVLKRHGRAPLTAALLVMAGTGRHPVSAGGWLADRMWYAYSAEYYSALEKKETWTHATV